MPKPIETVGHTPEQEAAETIADYRKSKIRSFDIINGRVWCDQSNLLRHLVRSPKSVEVLADHYRQKTAIS